jgi:aliphatic sulfonates family ABC transporter substrate-binding protein
MKKIAVFTLALALMFTFTACSKTDNATSGGATAPAATTTPEPAAPAGVTIRLATQPSVFQPAVAQEKGYFTEEGLNVVLENFSYGPPIIESITAKEADFGFLGDLPAFNGIANGADIIIVGTIGTSEVMHSIIVRDASNIASLADLKGKKIAVPFGSNTQPLVYLFLDKGGVSPDDVEIINLAVTDAVTSIVKGDIDAAVIWEPNVTVALKPGNGVSVLATAEGVKLFVDPLIARSEFTNAHPEETAKLLRALDKAGQWAMENPAEAAALVAQISSIDEDSLRITLAKKDLSMHLTPEGIEALQMGADQAFKYELTTKQLNITDYINTTYLEKAGIQ